MSKFNKIFEESINQLVLSEAESGKINWDEFKSLCKNRFCRTYSSILYRPIVHKETTDFINVVGNEKGQNIHTFIIFQKDNPDGFSIKDNDTVIVVIDRGGEKIEEELVFMEYIEDIMKVIGRK